MSTNLNGSNGIGDPDSADDISDEELSCFADQVNRILTDFESCIDERIAVLTHSSGYERIITSVELKELIELYTSRNRAQGIRKLLADVVEDKDSAKILQIEEKVHGLKMPVKASNNVDDERGKVGSNVRRVNLQD